MGYLVFLFFVFMFVIVLMNLLNAIAIGDVQKLQEDSVQDDNITRIMTLIDQDPQLTEVTYKFDYVNLPCGDNAQSSWNWGCYQVPNPWTKTWLKRKVRLLTTGKSNYFAPKNYTEQKIGFW